MKIPPEIVLPVITILAAALDRGYLDARGLEPLLKIIVTSGNGPALRRLIDEVLLLLTRLENEV